LPTSIRLWISSSNLSSIAKILLLSCAKQIQHRFAHRCGVPTEARKKDFHREILTRTRKRTCGCPQKEAVSGSCSEQDDKRFRFRLGRPRAGAHFWGRGARILTEINRIPRSASQRQNKIATKLAQPASRFRDRPGKFASHPLLAL
jgi:hypothetical protein